MSSTIFAATGFWEAKYRIKSGCEKKGRPITFADAWIAAAALQLSVPLVTHNASDYRAVEKLTVLTATAAP